MRVFVELADRRICFDADQIEFDTDQYGNLVVEGVNDGVIERLGMFSPEVWRSVARSEMTGWGDS